MASPAFLPAADSESQSDIIDGTVVRFLEFFLFGCMVSKDEGTSAFGTHTHTSLKAKVLYSYRQIIERQQATSLVNNADNDLLSALYFSQVGGRDGTGISKFISRINALRARAVCFEYPTYYSLPTND